MSRSFGCVESLGILWLWCLLITPGYAQNLTFSLTTALPPSEQAQILSAHNHYRHLVAGGNIKALGGALPMAADIKKMKWSPQLAAAAQAHADLQQFAHSKPNPDRYGTFYGQNLSINMTNGGQGPPNWPGIVEGWFQEYSLFPMHRIEPFVMERSYGHFSQLVWANTDHVGCGRRAFRRPGHRYPNQILYTCNYGPPGNYISPVGSPLNRMYKKGKPCTSCTCDKDYKTLCQ